MLVLFTCRLSSIFGLVVRFSTSFRKKCNLAVSRMELLCFGVLRILPCLQTIDLLANAVSRLNVLCDFYLFWNSVFRPTDNLFVQFASTTPLVSLYLVLLAVRAVICLLIKELLTDRFTRVLQVVLDVNPRALIRSKALCRVAHAAAVKHQFARLLFPIEGCGIVVIVAAITVLGPLLTNRGLRAELCRNGKWLRCLGIIFVIVTDGCGGLIVAFSSSSTTTTFLEDH